MRKTRRKGRGREGTKWMVEEKVKGSMKTEERERERWSWPPGGGQERWMEVNKQG